MQSQHLLSINLVVILIGKLLNLFSEICGYFSWSLLRIDKSSSLDFFLSYTWELLSSNKILNSSYVKLAKLRDIAL